MYTKSLLLILLLLSVLRLDVNAQIKLNSELEFTSYVQYEPILMKVTVTSELGKPSVFNREKADPNFYYLVKDENGYVISPREGIDQPHPEMIPARASETITNNLIEYFSIQKPGYYSVQPSVDWRGKSYRGEKKQFEVVRGHEVARAFGVVPADGSERQYSLLHINRKMQDHLLLRIDDEDAHLCYGVFPLGRTISSSKPKLAIDRKAQAHVVYRASPQAHTYASFSPMGYLLDSEVYGIQYSDIELISLPDGTININGTVDERKGNNVPFVETILDKKKNRPDKKKDGRP